MKIGGMLGALKAVAEPTRLRILVLLAESELTVKDLTRILGQSQPRISRHLKLLSEAGLIDRFRDGSWVYLHIAEGTEAAGLGRWLVAHADRLDPMPARDRDRLETIHRERAEASQAYFRRHAGEWDRIRALHVAEAEVETAMREALGPGPFASFVDLGTGTGRALALFADRYARGLGLDVNQAMLAFARENLAKAGLEHAEVRHGDLYELALPDGYATAVVMHQVLHYLADAPRAVREAARILAPGGRLLIVDFAPHDLEFLREEHAHVRLGLADAQVKQWLADAGLVAREPIKLGPAGMRDAARRLTVSVWLGEKPGATELAVGAGHMNKALEGVR